MCAWMGAQLHGSRASQAGAGKVLALTIVSSPSVSSAIASDPSTVNSQPADAGGARWTARAATTERTHPAD